MSTSPPTQCNRRFPLWVQVFWLVLCTTLTIAAMLADIATDLASEHWPLAVLSALAFTFIVSTLGSVFLSYFFVSRLRKRHSATWETLGRPSRLMDVSAPNFAFSRFIWRRQYSGLPDEQAIRLGTFARGFLVTTVALGVLTVLWFGVLIVAMWQFFRQPF